LSQKQNENKRAGDVAQGVECSGVGPSVQSTVPLPEKDKQYLNFRGTLSMPSYKIQINVKQVFTNVLEKTVKHLNRDV
jgi:hypothetical protein